MLVERLSKPRLSRFTVFEIPEHMEFETISVRLIKKLHQNAVIQIASSVSKTCSRDIRDVVKVAKLCNLSAISIAKQAENTTDNNQGYCIKYEKYPLLTMI
ncbi:MAG: hypothetical protein ACJ702_06240 [Nitrososphaeraceae archaeon]